MRQTALDELSGCLCRFDHCLRPQKRGFCLTDLSWKLTDGRCLPIRIERDGLRLSSFPLSTVDFATGDFCGCLTTSQRCLGSI
jgi:hypothetical protein